MRIVIDTNVLVSVMAFPLGATAWLRAAWETGVIIPLVSGHTIAELRRVLRYPRFRLTEEGIKAEMEGYRRWCETVAIADPPAVPDCRDPSDRIFLELAQFAQASALITGDDDLLALAPVFPIPIITPGDLRSRLGIAGH